MRLLAALAAGLLFGAGLSLSRMIDPAVVLAFLDFAAVPDGRWNPALAFVMAGALLVTAPRYALIFRRRAPLLAPAYAIPSKRSIDGRLIAGAMTFGLGWGLIGTVPDPPSPDLASGWRRPGSSSARCSWEWLVITCCSRGAVLVAQRGFTEPSAALPSHDG